MATRLPQEALRVQAGTVDISRVDPADPIAAAPERAQLHRTVRGLIADVSPPERVRELDEAEEFDEQLYAALVQTGVLGIGAPVEAGGDGDVRDQIAVIEELAAGPTSMAAFVIAHYAVTQTIAAWATNAHQRTVAADLVAGRTRASFALSEPGGGTDVARAMRTRAMRSADGWILDGQKMWTSGATMASWIVVLARTSDWDRSPVQGITMFLCPADAPGVTIHPIDTLGIHGLSTCEVFFSDVRLPTDAVLGEVDRGMRQVFATINREGLHSAAACLGVGWGALSAARDYAVDRLVFDRPVASFQTPQHWLVDGVVALEAARGLLWRATQIEVGGGDAAGLVSMAKLTASEAASEIALRGMQLMGGAGYSREMPLQRFFRDGRLWSFSPLTNEMVRNRIGETVLALPRSY